MKIVEVSVLAFDRNQDKFIEMAKKMKNLGIKNIHYDVMDNIFVPNTAYNGEMLDFLKQEGFQISVHLMVADVEKYVNKFISYDIDFLTFHCEAVDKIDDSLNIINKIKNKGIKAGIAIKPKTEIDKYIKLIELSEIITVMGVQPGFGGQKYIPEITEKLKKIKKIVGDNSIIQLDGGVNIEIIKETKKYVDFFVSGSFLVNYSGDIKEIFDILD